MRINGGQQIQHFSRLSRSASPDYPGVVPPRSGDPLDEPDISKSGLYDVKDELITIIIPWNDTFLTELVMKGIRGTNYSLLLVPADFDTNFRTIRDALNKGGRSIQNRSGPP